MSVTRKKPFSVHNLAIYQKMNKECKVKTVTAQDLALKGILSTRLRGVLVLAQLT